MPPKKKNIILTEQEKKAIIKRHHELVDMLNQKLPEELKIRPDEDAIKIKLNDPQELIAYRVGLKTNVIKKMQDATLADLKKKYPSNFENYGFKIERYFDVSDNENARQYNEELYQKYIADPETFMNNAFSGLVSFNPIGLYECEDEKGKLAEFYANNFEICENSKALAKYITNNPNVRPEIKAKKNGILAVTDALKYPVKMCEKITSSDYLACPELTKEQALKLDTGYVNINYSQALNEKIHDAAIDEKLAPKAYYDALGLGETIEEGNCDELPLDVDLEKKTTIDGQTITTSVSANEFLAHKDDDVPGVEYETKLDVERQHDVLESKCLTANSKQKIVNEWGKRLNEKLGIKGEYSAKKIEDAHSGNIFEKIKGSTSREYKALRDAIKEYSDPNSPNYMNYQNMKEKAEVYIAHKEEQGYLTAGLFFDSTGIDDLGEAARLAIAAERHQELNLPAGVKPKDLSGTSLKRVELAKAIIDLESDEEEIRENAIGSSVKDLAGYENNEHKYIDLFDIHEKEEYEYEEEKIEEAKESVKDLEEMPFANSDDDIHL